LATAPNGAAVILEQSKMALGDKKSFVLTQGGVSAEVWLEDMGSNHTQVAVKALAGTLDVNALFWDLVGGDNSLAGAGIASGNNMNGVGSRLVATPIKSTSAAKV
jgi:hypothetical protein